MSTTQRLIHKTSDGFADLPVMEIPNAWIGDVYSNPSGSEMSCGFFRMEPGEALQYVYTYDEMKVVLEGDFTLTDEDTGQVVQVGARDVLFFPKGIRVLFETTGGALAFFTGHRSFAP